MRPVNPGSRKGRRGQGKWMLKRWQPRAVMGQAAISGGVPGVGIGWGRGRIRLRG